jgi:hypothetical protein
VARETSRDAGEVDFARPVEVEFAVSNAGGLPLRLTLIRKSCSCGVVQPAEQDIAAGEAGVVRIRWTPIPGSVGPYVLSTDFETNDPEHPLLGLEVKGQVQPQIRIWPEHWAYVDLGRLRPGSVVTRELSVFSTRLDQFGLRARLAGPSAPAGLSIVCAPLEAGAAIGDFRAASGYRVTIQTSPALPAGYLRETLMLTLLPPGEPPRMVELPVYGEVDNGVVRILPEEVKFERARVTEADSKKVRVQFLVPAQGQTAQVVRCEPSFLTTGPVVAVNPQGLWQFTVSIPANHPEAARYQAEGFFEGRIILRLSDERSELAVRVKWVRPD